MTLPWHVSSLRRSALSAVSLNALYKPTKREGGSILLRSQRLQSDKILAT